MEIAIIGVPLLGGAVWLKYRPTRVEIWNWIAAWAAANRDAAMVRQARRREYLGAAVPEVGDAR